MKKIVILLAMINLVGLLFYTGCENNYPDSLWPTDTIYRPNPVITSIDPPDSTFSGIGILTITGQNFSTVKAENFVYFGAKTGTIQSASATELVVQAPVLTGDSITINVWVTKTIEYATYTQVYALKNAIVQFKGVGSDLKATAIAVDKNEGVYALLDKKKIVRIANPDAVCDTVGSSVALGITNATSLRLGPNNYLYLLRGNNRIYRLPLDGGPATPLENYVQVSSRVTDMDFDINKNIFAGGKGFKIECVHTSDNSTFTAAQPGIGYSINSLRVFDGYLYMAARNDTAAGVVEGIWKYQITNANGDLGAKELVFDWTTYAGSAGPKILSVDFDENGLMYLGLDKDNALAKLNPANGTIEGFVYPEIMIPKTAWMSWGNSIYLYINRDSDKVAERRIIRVNMNDAKGAPYYGLE